MKKALLIIAAMLMAMPATATAEKNINPNGSLPVEIEIRAPRENAKLFGSDELPEKFDLRDVDGKSYITSVKNQEFTSQCWAYALAASAESCWMRDTGEEIDVSESHINMATTRVWNGLYNPDGSKSTYDGGGQALLGVVYASRGSGLVAQEDCPQHYLNGFEETYIKPSYGITSAIVSNRYYPENEGSEQYREDMIDMIKNDLYANKTAIVSNVLWDDDCVGEYYPSFYNPAGAYNVLSHSVSIIGWDDTYPAENFNIPPAGDGAWIIKNSYGKEDLGNGYLYLSYYDLSAYGMNVQVTGMQDYRDSLPYDNRYYHDMGMFLNALGYEDSNSAYAMNLFRSTHGYEDVVSVNIAFNGPTEYEVYIKDDVIDFESINASELSPVLTGSVDRAGYYQLEIPEPPNVSGDFAVIVKYSDESSSELIPIAKKIMFRYSWYDYEVDYEEGNSFISPDGKEWTDIGAMDMACTIKAFTTDTLPTTTITVNPVGIDKSSVTISMQDISGNDIPRNADGTFTVSRGGYRAMMLRSPRDEWSAAGLDKVYYEPSFTDVIYIEDDTEDLTVELSPSEERDYYAGVKPAIYQEELIYFSPYVDTQVECAFSLGYGYHEADKVSKITLVYENDEREELEENVDYYISGNTIYFHDANNSGKKYLFDDDERVLKMENQFIGFDIEFDDAESTVEIFCLEVREIDILKILRYHLTKIAKQSDAATVNITEEVKNKFTEYITSIEGVEKVDFSEDFKVMAVACGKKIDGSVTVTYNGEELSQDFSGYNGDFSRIKYVKKSMIGNKYTTEYLPDAYYEYNYHESIGAFYDEEGRFVDLIYGDERSYYGYFDVEDPQKGQKLKVFSWDDDPMYSMNYKDTIPEPVYDTMEFYIE